MVDIREINHMNDKSAKVAVSICVIKDGKLLLGKRKKPDINSGWGLPAGKVENNEYLIESARRELEEETGLKAELIFQML